MSVIGWENNPNGVCEDAPCCGCCGPQGDGVIHEDEYPPCPECGDPIDYCQGHGEDENGPITDPHDPSMRTG